MGQVADIKAFFKKVSEHPLIGSAPLATPPVDHFYGFNWEEMEKKSKRGLFFPCLGLSDSPHSGLAGSFTAGDNETSVTNMLGINILILDIIDSGDYNAEYELYDTLLPVCQNIVNYIQAKVAMGPLSDYPFLDKIDMSSISLVKVGPKGTAKAYGYKLSMSFRNRSINTIANPLNAILG